MTFINSWEDFEKAAEHLYMQDPSKIRYTMNYAHSKGLLVLKFTDNKKCLQYKTDMQQDTRKIDKFIASLMRDMTSDKN